MKLFSYSVTLTFGRYHAPRNIILSKLTFRVYFMSYMNGSMLKLLLMHGYHFRNFAKVIFLDLELEDKLKFRASSQTRTTRKIERAVKMEIVERNKLNGGMIAASFRSL